MQFLRLATSEVLDNHVWLMAGKDDGTFLLLLKILRDSTAQDRLKNHNNGPNECAKVNPFLELGD